MVIKNPTIAKEKYKWSHQIQCKLSYYKWTEFIDLNQDYYVWLESTKMGEERLKNTDKIPQGFREGIIEQLNKWQAFAEYSEKKGWYEVVIDFHKGLGIVSTTYIKPLTKKHLYRLLDMANYLDTYLLNNGNEIIDEEYLKSLA